MENNRFADAFASANEGDYRGAFERLIAALETLDEAVEAIDARVDALETPAA